METTFVIDYAGGYAQARFNRAGEVWTIETRTLDPDTGEYDPTCKDFELVGGAPDVVAAFQLFAETELGMEKSA